MRGPKSFLRAETGHPQVGQLYSNEREVLSRNDEKR
jgi:hypothetical protein